MAIASAAITTDQITRLLNLEEGHFADLKRIEVTPAKLSQSIAAFANADGGELFIGVDETVSAGAKVIYSATQCFA